MNIKGIALATIVGFSAPTIAVIAINDRAIATPEFPLGEFSDRTWVIFLRYENNAYHYRAENLQTGDSISLSGATVSGTRQRRTYTWRNGRHRYEVAWRPNDPYFIRVQVFAPNGKQIFNRLLSSH
ncbi:MAG: hypothetical protein Fur006_05270 [Coleofasciculaceae cyanobacterium]